MFLDVCVLLSSFVFSSYEVLEDWYWISLRSRLGIGLTEESGVCLSRRASIDCTPKPRVEWEIWTGHIHYEMGLEIQL